MSKEFRVGIFVAGGLAILAVGVFLIGSKQSLFSSTYELKTRFDNVTGLINGAEVRIGGTRQGIVERIELPREADGQVTVVMSLEEATRGLVREDSRAEIQSEGLLGDRFVEISMGSKGAAPVEDGDTIESRPPIEMAELFEKAKQLLETTQGVAVNAEKATGSIADITAKVNQGQGTAGALINDKALYRQTTAGVTSFRENMDALKSNFFLRGFFNDRGYRDSDDLTKDAVARLPKGNALKSFTFDGKRIFDGTDTAKLDDEKRLNPAGAFLQQNDWGLAVVAVYGGMTGDTDEMLELTQARAMVVRDYLVEHFPMDDTKVRTIGFGKTDGVSKEGEVRVLIYPRGTDATAEASRAQSSTP